MRKHQIIILILEAPIIAFLLLGNMYMRYLVYSFGFMIGVTLYAITFIISIILTVLFYMTLKMSAYKKVSGSRYIVGIVYDEKGQADYIELKLGSFSRIGEVEKDGKRYSIYAVFSDEEETIDYCIALRGDIEEVFASASIWEVDAGWFFAPAQVYPVSMIKTSISAIDYRKLDNGKEIDPTVPVYIIRDASGFVVSGEGRDTPPASLAEDTRKAVDKLLSAELYYENKALKEELESLKETQKKIDALAIMKAQAYIKAHLENQREPRRWSFRLGKWEALVIITVLVVSLLLYVLNRYPYIFGMG